MFYTIAKWGWSRINGDDYEGGRETFEPDNDSIEWRVQKVSDEYYLVSRHFLLFAELSGVCPKYLIDGNIKQLIEISFDKMYPCTTLFHLKTSL